MTSVADGAQTITDGAVTNAKLADMATQTVKGRDSAGDGAPEDLSVATLKGMIGDASDTATGLVELATTAETQAGTDTTRAVTPAGLRSVPFKVLDFELSQRLGSETDIRSLTSLGSGVVLAGTVTTGQIYKSHEIEVSFS